METEFIRPVEIEFRLPVGTRSINITEGTRVIRAIKIPPNAAVLKLVVMPARGIGRPAEFPPSFFDRVRRNYQRLLAERDAKGRR